MMRPVEEVDMEESVDPGALRSEGKRRNEPLITTVLATNVLLPVKYPDAMVAYHGVELTDPRKPVIMFIADWVHVVP